MTRPIPRIIAFVVCMLIGIVAAQAFADQYNHINSLARKIHNKSEALLKETKHYRSTPNYVHMVRNVAELDQLACHLRDAAKNEGDLDLLAYDIAQIDAKFHHVEALFDQTELCAVTYGRGFIKGHTAHVKRLLNNIEDAIHHIGDDIEHLRAATPVISHPAALPYNGYGSRPIVTKVETYQIPNQTNYRAPYDGGFYEGSSYGNQSGRGDHGQLDHHSKNRHASEGYYGGGQGGFGFSIGGGSTRITFRF